MSTMKTLQTGDLHVGRGRSSWGEALSLSRSDRLFEALLDVAAMHDVDAILITGDLFDNKAVTDKERNLVTKWLLQLGHPETGFPTYVIPGNHDLLTKYTSNLDYLVEVCQTTNTQLRVAPAAEPVIWTAADGLDIVGAPVSFSEDQTWMDHFIPNLDPTNRYIFMGHGTIGGCYRNDAGWRPPEEDDERRLTLAKFRQSPVVWFAYGDIHARQQLPGIPESQGCYAGSPIQMDFGENQNRGVQVITLGREAGLLRRSPWRFSTMEYVRIDDRGFEPLMTVTDPRQIEDVPKNAMLRLAPGVVLPKHLHDRVVKEYAVVDDRSTPEMAVQDQVTPGQQMVQAFDPLASDLAAIEAHVLENFEGKPEEAKRVIGLAVERYRARTYVS